MKKNKYTRGEGLLEGYLSKRRTEKANSLIYDKNRDGRILDIGCGSYPYFLTNTEFKEKYGIDPSLTNLKLKNIELKKIDVTKQKLPFKDNFFDVVTMLAVFEHLERDKTLEVLKEARRTLKEGGVLIITTPAPWSDKLLHVMARTGLVSKEEIHEHKHHFFKSAIEDIINQSGFKNIRSGYFEIGFNMWFTAKK